MGGAFDQIQQIRWKTAVFTAVFDCSVDMLAQICPPWVDGHWFINSNKILPLVRSSSGISSVYNMRVNGTSSQVYNITGFKDRSQNNTL